MRTIVSASLLVFATGCGCHLVSCVSGLTVLVTPQPARAYRVEVYSASETARYVSRCDDPARCSGMAVFPDFLPSRVHIDVIAGADTVNRASVSVKYETQRPNG